MMVTSQQPEVLQEAVKRLNQVMAGSGQDASQPEVLDALAIADLKLKKPEEAVELLQKALGKFPNDLKSAGALAAIQFGQHNFAEAEETLKKAVAQAPQSAQAALALANLYLLENKKLEAEPELRRAIQLDPSNAPALLMPRPCSASACYSSKLDARGRCRSDISESVGDSRSESGPYSRRVLVSTRQKSGSGRGTGKASQGS